MFYPVGPSKCVKVLRVGHCLVQRAATLCLANFISTNTHEKNRDPCVFAMFKQSNQWVYCLVQVFHVARPPPVAVLLMKPEPDVNTKEAQIPPELDRYTQAQLFKPLWFKAFGSVLPTNWNRVCPRYVAWKSRGLCMALDRLAHFLALFGLLTSWHKTFIIMCMALCFCSWNIFCMLKIYTGCIMVS